MFMLNDSACKQRKDFFNKLPMIYIQKNMQICGFTMKINSTDNGF